MVHLPDEKMCTACHRLADEKGFTHLGGKRVASAVEAMVEHRKADRVPSATALRSYNPKLNHCLCQREDCIIHILAQCEKNKTQKKCLQCGGTHPGRPGAGAGAVGGGTRWSQRQELRAGGNRRESRRSVVLDPTLKNFGSLGLTKENCVMWLSEQSYVGSDNKTKTLVCKDCRPPTVGKPINCLGCRCKVANRRCSLSCGCRGTCNERRFPKPGAAPALPTIGPAQPAAPPAPVVSSTAPPAPVASSNAPLMHNTVYGALRAMMATRAAVAAARAEAAAAAQAEAEAAAQAEASAKAQVEGAATAQGNAAPAPGELHAAAPQAEGPPDTSEDNAPVVRKEVKISEDDTDRIPDWMSDSDDGDGGNDGDSGSDSDGGWDMSLEAGLDDPEWMFGDD